MCWKFQQKEAERQDPTHTREWDFPASKAAEEPQRSEANITLVLVLKSSQTR